MQTRKGDNSVGNEENCKRCAKLRKKQGCKYAVKKEVEVYLGGKVEIMNAGRSKRNLRWNLNIRFITKDVRKVACSLNRSSKHRTSPVMLYLCKN